MDNINMFLLVSRWIHISAAIVALGGAAYMFCATKSAATALDEESRRTFDEAIRKRWSKVVFTCIGLLLVTGGVNLVELAAPQKIKPMPYYGIFGAKFLLAMGVFFLASSLVGTSPAFGRLRARRSAVLGWLLAMGGVIVLLSGLLNQVRTLPSVSRTGPEPAAAVQPVD